MALGAASQLQGRMGNPSFFRRFPHIVVAKETQGRFTFFQDLAGASLMAGFAVLHYRVEALGKQLGMAGAVRCMARRTIEVAGVGP